MPRLAQRHLPPRCLSRLWTLVLLEAIALCRGDESGEVRVIILEQLGQQRPLKTLVPRDLLQGVLPVEHWPALLVAPPPSLRGVSRAGYSGVRGSKGASAGWQRWRRESDGGESESRREEGGARHR